MSLKILLLYASSKGSTKEVAEHIATHLSAHQPSLGAVTCLPITSSPTEEDLPSFDAIILGSAIHGGAWLAPATHYLSAHTFSPIPQVPSGAVPTRTSAPVKTTSILTPKKGLWAFSVGAPISLPPFMQTTQLLHEDVTIKEELEGKYGLRLKDHGFFMGRARREDVPWLFRGVMKWFGGTFGDFRDWDKIDAWTEGIVRALKE